MDFDLFEFDDDDDNILGSVNLEPSQRETSHLANDDDVNVPEFQCAGEDSTRNTVFATESFVRNKFIENALNMLTGKNTEIITVTHYDFMATSLRVNTAIQYIFGEAIINVQTLVTNVYGQMNSIAEQQQQVSFYQRRYEVTKLLYSVLKTTYPAQWALLKSGVSSLRSLINRLTSTELWKTIYFANSVKGNECNVPAYHLLHGLLEWKILDLCTVYKFELLAKQELDEKIVNENRTMFRNQFKSFIEDLVVCSLHLFVKKKTIDILFSSPFPCACFKETWLVLLLLLRKWNKETSASLLHCNDESSTDFPEFWKLVNAALIDLKSKIDCFKLNATSYNDFMLWMQSALIHLHGYSSNGLYEGPTHIQMLVEQQAAIDNYEFYENCVQQILNGNPNEEQLRVHISLLMPLILQWWPPRHTLTTIFWEYFHKRLNSSFYITGTTPNNLAVTCGSGRTYLEKYRALLNKQKKLNFDLQDNIPDTNLGSYTLFVLMLGKCLERFSCKNASLNFGRLPPPGNQTQKLLGRIFSKFSTQKLLALNEMGIHHVIELFIVLAMCGDFVELLPKLRDLMLTISFEKIPPQRQVAIVKGHMAMLILCAEQRCGFSDYVSKLLQQLQAIRNDVAVAKIIADGLLDIFHCADDFQRGEKLLIDSWLPSLLQSCTPVEQQRTLDALHLIFEKLESNGYSGDHLIGSNSEVLKALNVHILPFVKQQYTTSFSELLPLLAADFCKQAEPEEYMKILNYFIEAQAANRQALPQFLLKILQNNSANSIDKEFLIRRPNIIEDNLVLHAWLKSLVLLTPNNEVVAELTKHIVTLKTFNFMSGLTSRELLEAKEPLCVFIASVGKRYDEATSSNDYRQCCQISDNFNAYLKYFDKWLPTSLTNPMNNEQNKQLFGDRPESLFRFYSFMAIVIYNCPNIVYAKSKITCFFHLAMTRYFLPTSIQMGKQPEGRTAHFIHKVWPVLVQGIGRLNFKNDPYIKKTLNDMIQKWTPHFKSISSNSKVVARPYIICAQSDNRELSLFIFERLTNLFLATQRRQAQDPNACLVVTIFQEVIESLISNNSEAGVSANTDSELTVQRLATFMKATCLVTLEHIMMVDECVPSRSLLLEMFRRLICNSIFRNSSELQSLLSEHLRIITKKHLAYYTFFYFDLLQKLTLISSDTVQRIMDFVLAEVRIVEGKRNAGEDGRIRSCVQKLQLAIANEKKKQKI